MELVTVILHCTDCGHHVEAQLQAEHVDEWVAARKAEHAAGALVQVSE